MEAAIIIPARFQSSRLPGKPLLRETGKYLIQHVYEQASLAKLAGAVIVATDDSRIMAAVESFGGRAVNTRSDHASGTDRIAEVAKNLDAEVIVNVQGDEPLVDPESLDLLIQLMGTSNAEMATLAVPINSITQWRDPNCVKVVCDDAGRALYFTRSPVPFVRDGEPDFKARPPRFLQHLGIYAYRRSFLLQLSKLPPSTLEQTEKLEQLRVLALGRSIQVAVVKHAAIGVDTPKDYEEFVRAYREAMQRNAA
jgi:3-deoxy-manno-octulosonate cytidylyltransferase (CMP-KDO synthetase)